MTDRQRHILRILADPAADPPGLLRLCNVDREAIQAALDEIDRLMDRYGRLRVAPDDLADLADQLDALPEGDAGKYATAPTFMATRLREYADSLRGVFSMAPARRVAGGRG